MKTGWWAVIVLGVGLVTGTTGCARMSLSRSDKEPEKEKIGEVTEDFMREGIRRRHLRFRNKREINEFLALEARWREAAENVRATERIAQEKVLEVQEIAQKLETEFRIGDRTQWDPQNKTLYEVDSMTGKRRVVKEVTDTGAEARLMKMLADLGALRNEALALQEALNRRRNDLYKIVQIQSQEYAMSPEREYEVDQRSRILYEIIYHPSRFTLIGDRK